MKKRLVVICLCFIFTIIDDSKIQAWGFWGHQRINQKAVYCLPQPLLQFYKSNIDYITKHAVDPDMRRYADPEEAPRHYIDIDHYGATPFDSLPLIWKDAVAKIGMDSLKSHGIVPYHIPIMYYRLVAAFKAKDYQKIFKYSAEIGHYIGDAHVPLHCTSNYNGQKTGQHGIHGFWESRIPELMGGQYDFLVGKAFYIQSPIQVVWQTIKESYAAKDSVLVLEAMLNKQFESDRKYAYETKGRQIVKVYSREYTSAYNDLLDGMVERRMRKAIRLTASFWYTAWVNAGMPILNNSSDAQLMPDTIMDVTSTKANISIQNLKGHDD
ncbi:MAG: zinc dependent phospholipase C family protein [Bacteroidota bacterium]